MRWVKATCACVFLIGTMASSGAWADHGHHHGGTRFGLVVEAPLFWSGYYAEPRYSYYPYDPYYGYPYQPVIVVPEAPITYIEKDAERSDQSATAVIPAPAQQANYWYYCNKPDGYYPYVKQCPGGWKMVPAQPPSHSN